MSIAAKKILPRRAGRVILLTTLVLCLTFELLHVREHVDTGNVAGALGSAAPLIREAISKLCELFVRDVDTVASKGFDLFV